MIVAFIAQVEGGALGASAPINATPHKSRMPTAEGSETRAHDTTSFE